MKSTRVHLAQGEILLERLLGDGVEIAHDCGGVLACASCRVVVREGLERVAAANEPELDMLERCGGTAPGARLACQVKGVASDLVVDLPRREAHKPDRISRVSVTARAARHLAAQLEKHPGAVAVRLAVAAAGCSGFRYRLDPATALREDDTLIESGAVPIVIDAASLPYLHGTTIDLVQEGLARRLRFDNPNARERCGCGESFGL